LLTAAEAEQYPKPFSLRALIDPFHSNYDVFSSAEKYRRAIRDIWEDDIQCGIHGNRDNPHKAAMRTLNDLVNNVRELVDHKGLTATSERVFREVFDRFVFRKLAPGLPVKSKEKLLALEEIGLLNMSVGPYASVRFSPDRDGFIIRSKTFFHVKHFVQNLAAARIPTIGDDNVASLLPDPYKRMMQRGDLRFYENVDSVMVEDHETNTKQRSVVGSYRPGLIDVDRNMCAVNAKGDVNPHIRLVGIPVESIRWHSNLLGRAYSESTAWTTGAQTAFSLFNAFMAKQDQLIDKQKRLLQSTGVSMPHLSSYKGKSLV